MRVSDDECVYGIQRMFNIPKEVRAESGKHVKSVTTPQYWACLYDWTYLLFEGHQ
jgi:hypothetical protein